MATATAPTAVTDPAEPAAAPKPEPTPAAAPGPLARILTPVEPARPVQPLGSTAAMGQQAETASGKDSNASAGKSTPAKNNDRGSAVAALVHALAARLGRGGTAVKRNHTITETRVSGSTSTGTNKNDRQARSTQTGQHRTNRDAKTADLNNKQSQRHGRNSSDTRKADTSDAKTSAAKTAPAATKSPSAVSASMPDARVSRDTGAAKSTDAKGSPVAKPAATARPDGPSLVKPTPATKADPKGLNAKTKPVAEPAAAKPAVPEKEADPRSPATPATRPAPSAAPRPKTRTAREAGYRDGTRAAAATGQVRAYKDGVVDGWDDRTAADKAEGKTMSDTRARNAAKPKLPSASGSTVDLAKKAATAPAAVVPAQVTAVGAKAVEFTSHGVTHTMSRGEVRTLKAFERRLGDKKAAMGRVAEGSKATRLQAVELATRAQRLAENAKSVHGGARIVTLLSRLAERSKVLRLKAEEIEKNAHRGSEAVKVLAANANTRHGGIYKAVVDSPLTTPAEREFYMDRDGG